MVTLLEHGVTVHSDAEGSIVQSCEVEEKQEESTLKGMVATHGTQIVRAWAHSKVFDFTVVGSGDITLDTASGSDESKISSIPTGGLTMIYTFKYSQKLGEPSQWTYTGKTYPYGSSGS